jgi:heme exporter protein A
MLAARPARLILRNISKSFPGRKIFSNIEVQVDSGTCLVITGPNGSGKSTLLRIICGLLTPTRGKVSLEYNDSNFGGTDIRPYIGMVSPDLVLYDELTALENLSFFGRVSGHNFSEENLNDRLTEVGLIGRGHDFVGSYSSGMRQRLKYCLALMRNPVLLLLDEPTSNLDDAGKEFVKSVVEKHDGILVIATNEKSEWSYGQKIIKLGQ